jgi:hypothetical protein
MPLNHYNSVIHKSIKTDRLFSSDEAATGGLSCHTSNIQKMDHADTQLEAHHKPLYD